LKKIIMMLILSLFPITCSATPLNIGTFGNNTYILQTESLRFCSTSECLYIRGQEQQYVAAKIAVQPKTPQAMNNNEDALSYNKSVAYIEKTVLFARDGSQFVLLQTVTYDINGNPIDVKNETEEMKTFVANSYSVTAGSSGANETRGAVDVKTRRVAWSSVFPGTPGELLARAVLSYAESNADEIDAKSSGQNYIQVGK
jgi:hypothetical protein